MNDMPTFPGITGGGDSGIIPRSKYSGLSDVFEKILIQAASATELKESIELTESIEPVASSLSLEDFKKEFHAWLDTVPIHSSQEDALRSVSIHDKTFEKMMDDPEFREEVESLIIREFSAEYVVPPAFVTMRFDENGVYTGSAGGGMSLEHYLQESRDAFWSRGQSSDTDSAEERAEKKRLKRKETQILLEKLSEERRQRRLDSEQQYFYRFTAENPSGMPYRKAPQYASPPLDLSCLM